jgi:hypothetical protein
MSIHNGVADDRNREGCDFPASLQRMFVLHTGDNVTDIHIVFRRGERRNPVLFA